ncbi:DoxX family protein [Streptomyces sp.]|uniref:DoxX family protein n=1 Tax=Streptomyces sp. TaxID=1931 RepID=UPI002D48FE25|nr:DoxX family protein [Streptomyces sp.]HZF92162.1 DoxX family protein [Streptomyces sp.]
MSETAASVSNAPVSNASVNAAPVTTSRGRSARFALRAVQVPLALFFGIASALPKLVAHPSAVEPFERMGWGDAGMYTIGVLELAGAVALSLPLLQSLALSGLMAGAFIVQLTVFDGEDAATPLILLVPLALVAWARRGHTTELLRRVRRVRHVGRMWPSV